MRRLTVALSRARLGLYILGRRAIFETCYELQGAFERLLARPDKLKLVVGEMFPAVRGVEGGAGVVVEGETEMEGVEHLGKYVFEMTQAKVAALREGGQVLPPLVEEGRVVADGDEEEQEDEGQVVPVEEEAEEEVDDDDGDGAEDGGLK